MPEADREKLIEAVKLARYAGESVKGTARRLGVSESFVRYHTQANPRRHARERLVRNERVDVDCAGCGETATLTRDSLTRRKNRGRMPYRCRPCGRRHRKGEPDLKYTHALPKPGADWLTMEERERPKAWARRVAKTWTPGELAEVLGALESLVESIRGEDDSSFARHPRRDKRREAFEPHPYAKLERPFGSKAAA